jgi:predicted transcriptional regulator
MRKQRVQEILDAFPEDVDLDAFLEKAIVLEKIEIGERQIANGETVTHEEAKKRLQKWLG